MLKRISVLLAFIILVGGSGYLLSSKLHNEGVAASSRPAEGSSERALESASSVVIPEGTEIEVRLLNTLSTKSNRVGDQFSASIERPIQVDGKEIVPRDSTALGVVTSVKESGRVKGRSYISLRLQSIELRGGTKLEVATNSVSRLGASNHNRNLALLGGGAGIGAGIGALAGGGKGLAIGGPVGFGAGLGTKALIRGHEVTIPSETLLRFTLKEPTNVKVS
ncbi:MAG: hypothetical protein LAO21_04395 [Acidobacteriia bacterium]|nr:hypothetical protein [Terriglobia bacterium]